MVNKLYQLLCLHLYTIHILYCQVRAIKCIFYDVLVMSTLACMGTWIYKYIVCEHHPLTCVPFHWQWFCHLPCACNRREEEFLFNMQHAPHWGYFLLCALSLHLSTTVIPFISNRGQGSGCLLHYPDPNAKPHNLSPEKQSCNMDMTRAIQRIWFMKI